MSRQEPAQIILRILSLLLAAYALVAFAIATSQYSDFSLDGPGQVLTGVSISPGAFIVLWTVAYFLLSAGGKRPSPKVVIAMELVAWVFACAVAIGLFFVSRFVPDADLSSNCRTDTEMFDLCLQFPFIAAVTSLAYLALIFCG